MPQNGKIGDQRQPKIRARRKQVAMGEVDEFEHAINHGVTQCHQGINAAHGQPICYLLKKLLHRLPPPTSNRCRKECAYDLVSQTTNPRQVRKFLVLRKNTRIFAVRGSDYRRPRRHAYLEFSMRKCAFQALVGSLQGSIRPGFACGAWASGPAAGALKIL